jgi:hypothetical protein
MFGTYPRPRLAALYGVATKVLLQAVKRNARRFPEDFMMQLTVTEWDALRSHFVTSKPAVAAAATRPMLSPSRASPCSHPSSAANARSIDVELVPVLA